MNIIKYELNNIVELKKTHPCGSKLFRVTRVGSEIRIVCESCGREMIIERAKLEKATKKIINQENQ
jgi:hypothetical protein